MNLGYKIKQLRNERDLSLEKLAQHLNIAKSILWKYEKDQAIPSAEIIRRIASFFNISTDYLLFDESEKENITKISDKRLLRQFEEIDTMDDKIKEHVRFFLELTINANKIKQMTA